MSSSTPARETRIEPISGSNTYKQTVYRTVYRLIQNLDLAPGERLVEQDLSERFGVSKTPIREALLLLEKDRLIEMVPHTGATVSWLSLADYQQQLFILDALELPALQLVGDKATADDFSAWASEIAAIEAAFRDSDLRTYRELVAGLHRQMFAVAGYPRLTELIASVQQALYRYGVLFVDSQEHARGRELEIVVRRLELLREGAVTGVVELVQGHHAWMLATARERVARRDPAVMQYLLDGQ
ncbi:GntR family transcriptional regulator [Conexibacter sp. JD483]|uniref:GntR family transcriptional regulator n=1 Tax=unclassified Conexibacter TaxID=2627773 RepID=UPI00271B22AB|nr:MULTISPECIES: GntR family transcriptional regulator [unclassified Conexibacter]MDO8189446.1 GntR family transcriptional regulator [Conexibacter sp. CPCC 205706]MDO8202039.1 GntR family transcriptional regulator [Conexibacter sp. CPCC 205762]MDR9372609.1 GntR family transcriptional regulator [Conexibacter sp. JD483]